MPKLNIGNRVPHLSSSQKTPLLGASIIALIIAASVLLLGNYKEYKQTLVLAQTNAKIQNELNKLKNEDQYKKNKALEERIAAIEKTYGQSLSTYEKILDARAGKRDTSAYEKSFASILALLSKQNYSSAAADLATLNGQIDKDTPKASLATAGIAASTANIPVNNTAPGSGYGRQKVHTDFGDFIVDVVAADLGSTRVIVDTASDGDCSNNCPVMSVGDYAARSGAFAAVNGSYFCPAEYPSCAGKTNSFDTLLMNKNKTYFNSANNVYSTVPAAIFSAGGIRYVGQSLEWGRDTGVDGVIANQPLLVSGGNVVFGGDSEVKRAGAGNRSFVGSSGSTAYIGVVYGVNAAQMARVLHAMGIQNALNLDSGGSTALWAGGYKAGPGRGVPNAVLFVHR